MFGNLLAAKTPFQAQRYAAPARRFADGFSRERLNLITQQVLEWANDADTVIWPAEVTGDPPGPSGDLLELYFGEFSIPDPSTSPPWATYACWIRPLTGETFTTGNKGMARLVGWRDDDGTYDAMPIYSFVSFRSPLTTKGDIYTRDSTGDQRKPIGAIDGMLATVEAANSVGWVWKLPQAAPNAPTSPAASPASTQVTVTWSAPSSGPAPTQYVVDYGTSSTLSTFSQYVVSPPTNLSATITGLSNGTPYYFRVYALNGNSGGAATSIVTATPAAPAQSSATIQSNGTSLVVAFNQAVTGFGAGANGFAMTGLTGGTTTLTYASGNGTNSVTFTISRTVTSAETGGKLAYTPGSITASSDGSSLGSFSNFSVTNNSTQATTYTTAGSYSFVATATSHIVECWGAGGGGGSGGGSNAGGGGGEYRKSTVGGLTIGNSYTVVVGAGGAAGLNGGQSSFNTTSVIGKGGAGGALSGGLGGSGGTGTTAFTGGNGAGSGASGGGGGSSAGTAANGANGSGSTGGTAPSGGGNGGNGASGSSNGTAGSSPGGGGGGSGGSGGTGGAGADGQVRIT